jgi:hypothetical protein
VRDPRSRSLLVVDSGRSLGGHVHSSVLACLIRATEMTWTTLESKEERKSGKRMMNGST